MQIMFLQTLLRQYTKTIQGIRKTSKSCPRLGRVEQAECFVPDIRSMEASMQLKKCAFTRTTQQKTSASSAKSKSSSGCTMSTLFGTTNPGESSSLTPKRSRTWTFLMKKIPSIECLRAKTLKSKLIKRPKSHKILRASIKI